MQYVHKNENTRGALIKGHYASKCRRPNADCPDCHAAQHKLLHGTERLFPAASPRTATCAIKMVRSPLIHIKPVLLRFSSKLMGYLVVTERLRPKRASNAYPFRISRRRIIKGSVNLQSMLQPFSRMMNGLTRQHRPTLRGHS